MKTIASCAECHYPIGISAPGEKIACPMCNVENEAIKATSFPNWIVAGLIGLTIGFILAKAR